MAIVDVREDQNVEKIKFSDDCYVRHCPVENEIMIFNDDQSEGVGIHVDDIENLIKALQLARQTW